MRASAYYVPMARKINGSIFTYINTQIFIIFPDRWIYASVLASACFSVVLRPQQVPAATAATAAAARPRCSLVSLLSSRSAFTKLCRGVGQTTPLASTRCYPNETQLAHEGYDLVRYTAAVCVVRVCTIYECGRYRAVLHTGCPPFLSPFV